MTTRHPHPRSSLPAPGGPSLGRWRAVWPSLLLTGSWLFCVAGQAAPEISEFMARNRDTLADGFGEFSDWIELHNPETAPVALGGWFLTDDPELPTRWALPEIELPGGGYLVVFASGRDGQDPAGNWHTNFRLDGDGEYVALVAPDGATVVSAYGPNGGDYPAQAEDVSYGRRQVEERVELLNAPVKGRFLAPSDGALGRTWTGGEEPFDDADWTSVTLPVGYETSGDAGAGPRLYWPLDEILAGRTPDRAGRRHALVQDAQLTTGARGGALQFDGEDDYVSYAGPDFLREPAALSLALWFRRDADHGGPAADTLHGVNNVLLAHSSPVENDNLEIGSEGADLEFYLDTREQDGAAPSLRVPAGLRDGVWHHLVLTYDASRQRQVAVYLDGQSLGEYAGWGGGFDVSDAPLSLGLARPEQERQGDFEGVIDEVALWARALSAEEVAALHAGAPPKALGGFGPVIVTDVADALRGRNASAYLRLPFDLAETTGLSDWALELRYDAGFVAWLNGTEIARDGAPIEPRWDSAAEAERGDLDALQWRRFPLSLPAGTLRKGGNLLAVQVLNSAVNDPDFLFAARLVAQRRQPAAARFFPRPTPNAPNGEGVAGLVAPVHFSATRGFYEAPFDLTLTSATRDAVIRFTTDGSAPTPTNGAVYAEPIRIATTTVVRAAAFREDFLPSPASAHTYLFLDDVLRQPEAPPGFPDTWTTRAADYAMDPAIVNDPTYGPELKAALRSHPVLSLSLSTADLFDPVRGIYAHSQEHGDDWERPVSVELFGYPDGRMTQIHAGLRMQGNASRAPSRPKHNMRLAFRRQYGAGRLRFRVFPDLPWDEFNNLILRGQNGDSWIHPNANQRQRAQYIRDQWHRDVQLAMGHPTLGQGHVHLYLNGLYWGFYHVIERAEAETMAEHFGGGEDDYDVVIDHLRRAGEVEAVDGDLEAWDRMMAVAQAAPADPQTFLAIQQYLDLTNFVDYVLMNFYSGNTDWDGSNWRAGRRREPGAGFRFFAWDSERTIGDSSRPALVVDTDITGRNVANRPSSLHQTLTANPEYRLFFADRIQRHCFGEGVLTPARAAALWQARVDEFRLPLVAEAARWGDAHRPGDPYDPEDEWMTEVNRLMNDYFPVRTGIVLEQLRRRGLLPDLAPPEIMPAGGRISAGATVRLHPPDQPGVEVLYTLDGSDPRAFGGAPGSNAMLGQQATLVRSTTLKARSRLNGVWSPLVEATFTVQPAAEFALIAAVGRGDPPGLEVVFSQPYQPADALLPGNYALPGQDVPVTGVRPLDEFAVLLETGPYGPPPLRLRLNRIANLAGDQTLENAELPVDLGPFAPADYAPLTWRQEPQDATVLEGQPWTGRVVLAGEPAAWRQLRWFLNGAPVDATEPEWTIAPTSLAQDGAQVWAEGFLANGVFGRLRSRVATLRVLPDPLPPVLTEVTVRAGADLVRLRFNEPVVPATATNAAHYALSSGPVHDVRLDVAGREVTLFTDPLPATGEITVQVVGVRDRSAAGNAADFTWTGPVRPPTYADRVAADGAVRYWRFEEPAGGSVASEVTGHDPAAETIGQLRNGVTLGQPGLLPAGNDGLAARFEGALQQRIDVPNGVDLNTAPEPARERTLELWFRPDALPRVNGDVPEVSTLYEQGGSTRALALYLYGTEADPAPQSADLIWFVFNNSGNDGPGDGWGPAFGNAVFVRTPVRLGEVHHAVGVFAGDPTDARAGGLRLYLDGVLVGEAVGAGQLYAHGGDVRIGHGNFRRHDNRSGDTGWFTGALDEVALYTRALSGEEVAAHFESANHPPPPPATRPWLHAARVEGFLVVEFGGVLQTASAVTGPWTDLSVASPRILQPGNAGRGGAEFLRARAVE